MSKHVTSTMDQLPKELVINILLFLTGDEICKLERLNQEFYSLLHMERPTKRDTGNSKKKKNKRNNNRFDSRRLSQQNVFHLNDSNSSNSSFLCGRDLWLYICDVHYKDQMKHRRQYPSAIQPQVFYMLQLKTDWYNEVHFLERFCANLEALFESTHRASFGNKYKLSVNTSSVDCCVFYPDLMNLYVKLYKMDKYFIYQDVSDHQFTRERLDLVQNVYPLLKEFGCDYYGNEERKKRLVILLGMNDENARSMTRVERKLLSTSSSTCTDTSDRKRQAIKFTVAAKEMNMETEHSHFIQSCIADSMTRKIYVHDNEERESSQQESLNAEDKEYSMDEHCLYSYDDFRDISIEDYAEMFANESNDLKQLVGPGQLPTKLNITANRLYQCWIRKWSRVLFNNPNYNKFIAQYDLEYINVIPIRTRFSSNNYLRMANGALIRHTIYAKWLKQEFESV